MLRKKKAPLIWIRKNQFRREAEQLPTDELLEKQRFIEVSRGEPKFILNDKYEIITEILRERLHVQEARPP